MTTQSCMDRNEDFLREKHIQYFLNSISVLPPAYTSLDTNRLSLAFFAISALDLLDALDRLKSKEEIIDWVYSLQIISKHSFMGFTFSPKCDCNFATHFNTNHIAMTYFALSILLILGDDFSCINRTHIIKSLRCLQRTDGSFAATPNGSESDMRFLYCACAISTMLGSWDGIDKDRAVKYINMCQSYDSGVGLLPGQESHGGSTYCSISALFLMNRLSDLPKKSTLLRWCMERQVGGFQGRRNKRPDTCYSFWVGATITLIGFFSLVNEESVRQFHIDDCQCPRTGGFSKLPGLHPDVLHSYFSICAMSLIKEPGILQLDNSLCISKRAAERIKLLNEM
eukprot:GSMAST32.ASY1.ANO1.1338.1 assembled CDS